MSLNRPDNTMNKGIPEIKDAFVVIVKTEWNAAIVDELEKGCTRVLDNFQVYHKTIIVPGAFELPFAIRHHYNQSENIPSAYIALGCVIKGDTPHFDYVCHAATQGILSLNLELEIPSVFGVLTVNDQSQAQDRIGGSHGHKGEEAAHTAIKMIQLINGL